MCRDRGTGYRSLAHSKPAQFVNTSGATVIREKSHYNVSIRMEKYQYEYGLLTN